MAQFVTHIQPTLVEASQGHIPFHHGHQVGHQHQSHLPHSGHNMPSLPIHNSHPHQQQHHTAQTHNKPQNTQHSKNHHQYKNYPTGYNAGDGNTSFLRSARAGNLEKVLEHLKNNIDINTCNTNGLNALHLASKDGHVHVVSELLKRGAIVDSATKKGNTALHIASLAGQEEVVALLLKSSAAVNVQSQNGFTPLYMAAQENHDSVVRLLLANGANQSLATEDGFTPLAVAMQQGHDKVVAVLLESDTRGKVRLPALHIAAKKDDVKAATLLLENEHNPDITSKSGFTPLHIASHYGNQSIANLLIQKGADVNFLAKHNISPLHVAAKWGKTNMVSLLLEKGAYIEAKTRDGLTPLHCAARSGHEQVVDMLLERGAPISAKTKNGLAPLHMAAQGEHVDAARILLYHRAPVDEVTVDYLTALHVAAHCGHVRVAKLLVDRNADANARALNGFTPLHIACKKNRIKVVELLLRHGASISATTESGLTPLHVAAFMGCMNIVIYLLQHDASPDVPTVRGETPLHLAARANQTDIIRILLRNGAQVDARAREQQTPLHIASRLGNVDIVMLLLQHGAQVDATTKDMYTALHIAAKEGQDEVSAVLIENGASLEFATKKGFTPLHLAAKYGHMKVAQLLLQKDANVDAQGKNGVTPLHVACHYDNQNVALLLLERGASPHAPAKNGHTPLHIAARKNQMDIATTLLEYGANADTESKAGFTPLHLSSQEGHAELSSLLIEHNANVNHVAKNGLTPMHLCAQEDNVNVAEVIFKNGANVDMVTKAGYTPLHVASHFGQSNMVRFLLQKSANVDADTAIGYTPLHQAAQQGHCHIVNVLLEHKANANAQTANGQTPLHIAKRLGYISVLDSLKSITNVDDQNIEAKELLADKYRVVAPEAMHETFMSDSEEEGGEDNALTDQPYRYLTVDEMKSLGDDSLPFDVTRDERMDSNRMTQSIENTPRQAVEETVSPHRAQMQHTMKSTFDGASWNIPDQEFTHIGRKLQWKNFLVSFLVDARGGAMRGCRHSGVKMIVPSRSTCQPTRITCRYVKPQRTMHPPQLMEGEALASRVLELGPVSVKFQGPVVMEIPHFASLRGKEREIIILRSDNGETWREHSIDNAEEITQEVYAECFEPEEIKQLNEQSGNHVCRFITYDFPQYFAVVSRIRQEVHAIGSEGGMVTSTVVPQVQAVFPQGALTKKIKVGLQAQPVDPDLTAKLLGRGVAVSPIVTVEPRRRKFHKAITLSMPAPKAHSQGMINQYSGNAPTLRLLCSITGGASRAQWEDVTGSTPLTFVNDCVSFTTTVSARFWLMDCRNISESTKMATDLYREVIHVPFMAKFVVFAKRVESNEAKLRVFCMTDDREDKTLEKQELFSEVAKSRNVEVLEGKPQYIEMAGNLVPVTKSGEQLQLIFKAFRENRLPFSVRVKDQHADIVGRTLFMKEPKIAKGEPPQHPICILNIILPEIVIPDQTQHVQEKYEIVCSQYSNSHFIGDLRIADVSNLLGKDYILLAPEIGISQSEINIIVNRYPNSIARQAQDLIRLFKEKPHYDINILEHALKMIGREDIFQKCRPIHEDNKTEEKSNAMENGKNTIQRIHDREEIKYSAEEKEVEESESDDDNEKRTVAERREKIVKRLSVERQIPASSQKREIVQEITEIKRTSLIDDKKAIHEEEIMLQMPIDNVIKSFAPENVVKMKLNKFETVETSIADFEKELHFKFKTSVRNDKSDRFPDATLKMQSNVEEVSKTSKFNTNEEIRKSSQHTNIETKPCLDNLILNEIKIEPQLQEMDKHSVNIKEETKEIKTTSEKSSEIKKPSEEFKTDQIPHSEPIPSKIQRRSIDLSDKTKDMSNLIVKAEEKRDDHEDKEPNLSKDIPNQIVKAEKERKSDDDDDQERNLPEGTEAKGTIKAVKHEEYTTEQPKVIAASEEHEMDIIRKEASVLIKEVLEESVTILNTRQQTPTEVLCENQKSDEQQHTSNDNGELRQTSYTSESICEIPYDDNTISPTKLTSPIKNDGAISPDTKEIPPTIMSFKKEQKVEKKFQKISSDVDNIDKSVESFDQTFSSFVNDDEISSLHQEFSKISWNESISTTTSTIADIEQNTPDTDNQDLLTDTGGENIQRDISEEMLNVAPCPTPRTCLENLDKSEGNKELLKSEELTHHEDHTKDFPVPQPRQMKNVVSPTAKIPSKTDDFIESVTSIHEISGMVSDVKEDILNIKEDQAPFSEVKVDDDIIDQSLAKASELSIKPLIIQHEEKADDVIIDQSLAKASELCIKPLLIQHEEKAGDDIIDQSLAKASELCIKPLLIQHEEKAGDDIIDQSLAKASELSIKPLLIQHEEKADDVIIDQSLAKASEFSIKPFIIQHEENDRLSPTKPSLLDEIDPLEFRDSISPGLSKGLPEMSLSPKQVTFEDALPTDIDSIGEDFGETKIYRKNTFEPSENVRLERKPSLSGIHEYTTPIDMDNFEDRKGEIEDNDEPQTSFYIGESSRNIIIKSKSSQYDDEEEGSSHDDILKDVVDEKEQIQEEGTKEDKSIASELLECNYIPIEKVVRQGSETRNDILEIENELEKPSLQVEKENLNETLSHSSIESKAIEPSDESSLMVSSTKELIENGKQDVQINKVEQQVTNKTSKLDLLLEKSELELSEKLSTLPSVKKLSDMIENYKADTSLSDQLLVERTLEEVELSLDAAKEELIQVVRDGKGIKESPSEFEFKNISHTNLNIDQGDAKCKSLIAPPILDDIEEASDLHDFMDKIDKLSDIVSSDKLTEFTDDTPAEKPVSPVSNKCSFHEVDNSSSSESNYKNMSRPCSSDFDTVQTFHTSSEYQTAMDASTFRGSTEYVSAVGTLESSGKTLSSRESMKSLSSEASGNLGSIDTSELSETLIASIADHDIQIELENEDLEALEIDNNVSNKEDINSRSIEFESPQTCMKRSQEMIFNKDESVESVPEIPTTIEQMLEEGKDECLYSKDIQLEEPTKTITSHEDNTVPSNFENLLASEGPSSLSEIEALASLNLDESVDLNSQIPQTTEMFSPDTDKLSNADEPEPRRRGHKRHESTSVSNELVKNLLEEEAENTSLEDTKNKTAASSNLSEDDFKGSESESDHDPYESEYSRAFKSPTQRKKKKRENKQVDALEEGQESVLSALNLAEQTIIEDVVTEELESLITAEDERRPSQNLQDYSKIPDITVTEEISQHTETEESDDFPDNTLYKVKTQDELNKVEDTPIPRTTEAALSKSEEEFNVLIEQQYKQKLADLNESDDFERRAPESPDSFEMVDQPDITDEFVIIEEVAKEANEFDVEGKSIKISSSKMVKKHDEEVEQILIKSAPAATNLGSQIFKDDLNFEFEESPPSLQAELDTESADMSGNKKWVEMQLSDHAAQLRYPYELERGVLEDIKEEDAEFEVGSSRISSFKDSFSSTPDYDILAGRKYFSKAENDNISMSSLQEFESLEQAISLENRRIHQGSTDSSNGSFTRRYTIKNAAGDDISFSSLKEFEGLENACIEAHLIEIKAKEEAALLLSRSDESNKSNNGKESTQIVVETKQITNTVQSIPKESVAAILKSKLEECEDSKVSLIKTSYTTTVQSIPKESVATVLKSKLEDCEDSKVLMETSNTVQSIPKESVATVLKSKVEESEDSKDSLMETSNAIQSITKESVEALLKYKLEECEDSKVNLMETSLDSIEMELEGSRNKFGYNVSEHESADSLEINKSVELVTSSIDSFDISKEITTKSDVDSLEPISCREGSVDSIEIEPKCVSDIIALEADNQGSNTKITETVTTTTSISVAQSSVRISMDMSNDSLNLCLDPTSSAATNATYFNEGDSLMSDSLASCASSTLIEDSAFPNTSQSFVLHSHTEKVYFEDKSIPANSKTLDDNSKEAETKP